MKKILLLLSAIALFLSSCNNTSKDYTLAKVGNKAPEFSIILKDGSTTKLSDLKGKVVWINFFATWCPPCRKELPYLEKNVLNKFKNNRNFELLVIGREHSWTDLDEFRKEQNLSLPFFPDSNRVIFSKYAKQSIPRNFIIDKEGNISVASVGFKETEFEEIIKQVEKLLE